MTPGRAVPLRYPERSTVRYREYNRAVRYNSPRHAPRQRGTAHCAPYGYCLNYRSTARWTRPDRTAARRPGPAGRSGPVSGARLQGPVATPTGTAHAGDPGVQRLRRVALSTGNSRRPGIGVHPYRTSPALTLRLHIVTL